MNLLKSIAGQPAHPIYVHFPVACLTLASLFLGLHLLDGSSRRINRGLGKIRVGPIDFEMFSFFLLLLGSGTGFVAVLSGLALVGGLKNVPLPHALLGALTVLCYTILLVLRWRLGPALYRHPLRFLYYVLNAAGLILLVFTGYEGGLLHQS